MNPRRLTVADYKDGVLSGDRTIVARAITLVESNAARHREEAADLLSELLPHTGKSVRVGITGAPGVGKSSLIETLGCHLIEERGKKLAVLAVDPSSTVTRGSILGDKTRMDQLSQKAECFIRPSPSGGTLGGVARKSRETMLVCEAAGFDTIFVETVGVGQSEVTVRSMVDFFLLVMIAGAGDELQGIKRGVMELADAVVFNKADGEGTSRAEMARTEFERAVHYLQAATEGWDTPVLTCSAHEGSGISGLGDTVDDFLEATTSSQVFEERRRHQTVDWVHALIDEHLRSRFFDHPAVSSQLSEMESSVSQGKISVGRAVEQLIGLFDS